jgi:beta-lactamase regulating signal transducer with metallopeptidase domain
MNTLTQLFDWLLVASLRASLLTLATLLIQAALHRHLGARMRYALWLPVLIVLLMPVLPQSQWSIEQVFQTPPQPVPFTSAAISPAVMETAPVVFEAPAPMPEPFNWQRLLIITWVSVSAGMLILGGISFLLTLRRFKQARHPASDELLAALSKIAGEIHLRHVPRVLIASSISSPAVTGLLRPTLLLPAEFDREFTPAEARLVLKHELMHLKRGDLPLNALMCVLMALHWFNPLLWVAFFKIRADREAACDAQVLHNASDGHRIEYGHALLKV